MAVDAVVQQSRAFVPGISKALNGRGFVVLTHHGDGVWCGDCRWEGGGTVRATTFGRFLVEDEVSVCACGRRVSKLFRIRISVCVT